MNNTDSLFTKIGLDIKDARTKKGLTQKQLGDKVGVGHEWICRIEKGNASSISLSLLKKIGDKIGLDLKFSFHGTPTNPINNDE